jgi:hypothetical protein
MLNINIIINYNINKIKLYPYNNNYIILILKIILDNLDNNNSIKNINKYNYKKNILFIN